MSFYRNKRKNEEDDFIDDRDAEEEDDESSDEDRGTRKKKVASKKSRKEEEDDESSDEEKSTRKKAASKKSRKEEKGGGKIDPETGITVCKISKDREVVVRKFKGRILVDIREFYKSKDGDKLPSRRGIALSPDQWAVLSENIEKVDAAIQEMT